jgi:excisionase family DNA binding protein
VSEIVVRLSEDDLDRLAHRVAELITTTRVSTSVWLDVAGAARHLATTEHAIRGLVKRRHLPTHRTENGRLRFERAELDAWARGDHS